MGDDFTSSEAARLAGFKKPYMLNHLEREGIFIRENFEDRRHGRVRKYTFGDVIVLRSINRMLELGARPARIRSVIQELTKMKGFTDAREASEFAARALGTSLFVSRTEAFLIESDQKVLELLKGGQMAFGFFLTVKEISQEVIEVVELYTRARSNNLKVDMPILDDLCAERGI
ncbi:MAG: MerR family transcriptional regulator [Sphingopyxis sp.]|uniref:MerR family transcriptional regulator n=1 Tax=Sphingopyxis sp. TaxID=1908224 RepID=UPI001A23355C|nr:MerR family transcriptional regulator [Sphingopyxis sp.]MBJ7500560.1 MerR family transcriptional regulator [Sphingopyxis sp.]